MHVTCHCLSMQLLHAGNASCKAMSLPVHAGQAEVPLTRLQVLILDVLQPNVVCPSCCRSQSYTSTSQTRHSSLHASPVRRTCCPQTEPSGIPTACLRRAENWRALSLKRSEPLGRVQCDRHGQSVVAADRALNSDGSNELSIYIQAA